METTTEATTEDLLVEMRSLSDQLDDLSKREKLILERWDEIENHLKDFHRTSGLKKISAGGMSITFDPEAMRATYEPEKWASIFKWAAETGHEYLIQRRLTDAKVLELIDAGVALPDGLNTESYLKVSARKV